MEQLQVDTAPAAVWLRHSLGDAVRGIFRTWEFWFVTGVLAVSFLGAIWSFTHQ